MDYIIVILFFILVIGQRLVEYMHLKKLLIELDDLYKKNMKEWIEKHFESEHKEKQEDNN